MNKTRFLLIAISMLLSMNIFASHVTKRVDDWKFKQARLESWHPATVPGVVHTDLLANGLIPDPYVELNMRSVQWIDKEDWEYETEIELSPEILEKENIRILFNGLDTYADVYLNDEKILSADNMFRRWEVDIKNRIRPGKNKLKVYFHSPVKIDMPKWEAEPIKYEAINDQSEDGGLGKRRISPWARKSGYHYGWDWGPRLVTAGIWRPVEITAWDTARISDVFYQQKNVTSKRADVTCHVDIESNVDGEEVMVSVADSATGRNLGSRKVVLTKGTNNVDIPFSIKSPELWWCNGLGDQHRYNYVTSIVKTGGNEIDSRNDKIGLRSIKLITKPDSDGNTFYFELNGVPVFAKGANFIPLDNFLPSVTRARYEAALDNALAANMNMLRVWGGGTYEDDSFYDLCDEKGIMLWHDFMFACGLYPAEGEFLENIRLEAIDNVKRLRNRSCIAIWCGNNECEDAWFNWAGWKNRYTEQNPAYAEKIWNQYQNQYYKTLPKVIEEYSPGTPYVPTSPVLNPDTGLKPDGKRGDTHSWEVWHGAQPTDFYNEIKSRFVSEYGFQSFPDMETVRLFSANEKDHDIYSDVMITHERGTVAATNGLRNYILREYPEPSDFTEYVYLTQVMQGDAVKKGIENNRRNMPYCMGSFYWQLNDCWPTISWSSCDYNGRWKALHYYARNAYAPELVSQVIKDGNLEVYVVADNPATAKGTITLSVIDVEGKEIASRTKKINLTPNSSSLEMKFALEELIAGESRENTIAVANLKDASGKILSRNILLLDLPKNMNYPQPDITSSLEKTDGGYRLRLSSKKFARAVYIATGDVKATFSDNYFDILPGETVEIKIDTDLDLPTLKKNLTLTTMADI